MNVDLFEKLIYTWYMVTLVVEYFYYIVCFYKGSQVTFKSAVKLFFAKKHFIFVIFRYSLLLVICKVSEVFSNLSLIVYGTEAYDALLYGLAACIIFDMLAAGFAMIAWVRMHHTL